MAEPKVRFVKTKDGGSIAYYEMGEGPPLVFVSSVLWSHLRIMLLPEYHRSGSGIGRGRRVIRYDARGTGLSSRDTLDYSLDARVSDLSTVVDHLQLDRFALIAVGHGSPCAISYAASHPQRVTHLVLFRPYVNGQVIAARDSFSSLRTDADWDLYTITMANVNLGFEDAALAQRTARRMREAMTLKELQSFIHHTGAIDVAHLLPRVIAPTLVGWAEGPSASAPTRLSLDIAKEIVSSLPDARLFTYTTASPAARWSGKVTEALEEFLGVGQVAASGAGSDIRAVLFTDLVGHTEMMSRLGDEKGREVLREHERMTREVLKQHGGIEVKTMGDGFLASFGSVTKAVECAVALQRAFAEREGEPLSVRVGLNAGEPIEEEGDLFGATVILASRIAAKAEGGEILVADTVRGLCSGKGFLFADRGEFVAKGFEEPVRVYEVRWRAE